MSQYINCNIIVGGDFNTYLDPELDKLGGKKEEISEYAREIKEFNKEFNLIDIWRVTNPEKKKVHLERTNS